jgi:hypothetical protein
LDMRALNYGERLTARAHPLPRIAAKPALCAKGTIEANAIAPVRVGMLEVRGRIIDTLRRVFEQSNPRSGHLQG